MECTTSRKKNNDDHHRRRPSSPTTISEKTRTIAWGITTSILALVLIGNVIDKYYYNVGGYRGGGGGGGGYASEEYDMTQHHDDPTRPFRRLQTNTSEGEDGGTTSTEEEEEPPPPAPLWHTIYVSFVLLFMFVALLSDRIGADWVMVTALTACMASNIISIEEGLVGFSNSGLMTVLVLFVVASGISHTGALDWYMGKLLGRPKYLAGAQVRLMVPIAIISAFLNNTPVVVVMIPIVLRWAKNVGMNAKQLLIPLSFASILGGTCTLIGTSTNLVVYGLLQQRYPDDPLPITLFSLGEYGIPVAFVGGTYLLLFVPLLLPTGKGKAGDVGGVIDGDDYVLMGARLTKWSNASGRSVKRSGLRDTGGIYLVSVNRAATGNVHRAVGQDFVLNVGDVLYFTGKPEGFGAFCDEHGLEVMTNEVEDSMVVVAPTTPTATMAQDGNNGTNAEANGRGTASAPDPSGSSVAAASSATASSVGGATASGSSVILGISPSGSGSSRSFFPSLLEDEPSVLGPIPEVEVPVRGLLRRSSTVGSTKKSLAASDAETRLRTINRMTDLIRGISPSEPTSEELVPLSSPKGQVAGAADPAQIVVALDSKSDPPMVIVGVNCVDRPGLLHDISKGILRVKLQCHSTEAAVVSIRSLSVWRCEVMDTKRVDVEEIWSVLHALLENETGIQAIKHRGIMVIRAGVTKESRLVGKTAAEVDFRETYRAAIVAVQRGGKNVPGSLSGVCFQPGDVLVLQANDDSDLLKRPDPEFYKRIAKGDSSPSKKKVGFNSMVKLVKKTFSTGDLKSMGNTNENQELELELTHDVELGGEQQSGGGDDYDVNLVEDFVDGDYLNNTDDRVIIEGIGSSLSHDDEEMEEEKEEDPEVRARREAVWTDLHVALLGGDEEDPDSRSPQEREFLTAMEIGEKSVLINKTAAQNGIDKLPGVFLVSIERPLFKAEDHDVISVTSNTSSLTSLRARKPKVDTIALDQPLQEGDILWFAGSANAVGDLRKIPGLQSYENDEVNQIKDKVHERRLVQAVVSRKGPLVGKTVAATRFRTRYGAAVIAVHREGRRVHEHPGKVKLQAGDVLLLEAGPSFVKANTDNDRSFALLAEVENTTPPRLHLFVPALVITAAMLAVSTAGVMDLMVAGLIASFFMVCLGMITQQEARDAIHWDVFVVIGAAFGIGTALENSGVATAVANFLVAVGTAVGLGYAGLFGAVYLATFLISNVVTNNAAAALIFPIAMEAAEQTGADQVLMAYNIMLAASASFMSPFGYTTNLLIYGPGGYKYADFLKLGTPMQIVLWLFSTALLSVTKLQFWVSWVVTGALFTSVALIRMVDFMKFCRSTKRDKDVALEDKAQ